MSRAKTKKIEIHPDNEIKLHLPAWCKKSLLDRGRKRGIDAVSYTKIYNNPAIENPTSGPNAVYPCDYSISLDRFTVEGNSLMSDNFDRYEVEYCENTDSYSCSCMRHLNGQFRKQCSHIAAVLLFEVAHEKIEEGDCQAYIDSGPWDSAWHEDNRLTGIEWLLKLTQGLPQGGLDGTKGLTPGVGGKEATGGAGEGTGRSEAERPQEGTLAEPATLGQPSDLAGQCGNDTCGNDTYGINYSDLTLAQLNLLQESFQFLNPREFTSDHLPAWCPALRPTQITALEQIRQAVIDGKRNILLEGPTGAGKSLIGYLAGKMLNARANYVCTTKTLQDQFEKDYKDALLLKGRANYPTADYAYEFPRTNCSDCDFKQTTGCSMCFPGLNQNGETAGWTSKLRCPYYKQKRAAQEAEIAILNTAYALTVYNLPQAAGIDNVRKRFGYSPNEVHSDAKDSYGFLSRGLAIYDEADELESSIMGFIEVKLEPRLLNFFKIQTPSITSRWPARIEFLESVNKAIREYEERLSKLPPEKDDETDPELENSKFLKYCLNTMAKINQILRSIEQLKTADERRESWVYDRKDESSCTFKPVRINEFANKALFDHSKINLVMSATIVAPVQFASDLGLIESETTFIPMPSLFPVERRPVYYKGIGNMSYKTKDHAIPLICKEIKLLRENRHGRMLVHTVSFDLTRQLYSFLTRCGFDVFSYNNASERDGALKNYLKTPNSILLAASMSRGVDLKYDDCRICVIPKIPYPSLGDKQVARRLYQPTPREGELWYKRQTLATIIQMAGRGMRAEDDWCRTYILDEQFRRLWAEMKQFAPQWFVDAVRFDDRDTIGKIDDTQRILEGYVNGAF